MEGCGKFTSAEGKERSTAPVSREYHRLSAHTDGSTNENNATPNTVTSNETASNSTTPSTNDTTSSLTGFGSRRGRKPDGLKLFLIQSREEGKTGDNKACEAAKDR